MPELPEVETVKKVLKSKIVNKEITNITINFDKLLKNIDSKTFIKSLTNKTIEDVNRIGKYLVISIEEYILLIHLRMEGKLFYFESNYQERKHDHVIFTLDKNEFLVYNDVRKFGTFDLIKKNELMTYKKVKKLGIEPFTKGYNASNLYELISKKKNNIKMVLLDQTIVSGLGNIYVDEVLFDCKILPTTLCSRITLKQCECIILSSEKILKKSIQNKGTTIKSFSSSDQIKGNYQKYLKVYKRENHKCVNCNHLIVKTKINGRGTHYCPNCQK